MRSACLLMASSLLGVLLALPAGAQQGAPPSAAPAADPAPQGGAPAPAAAPAAAPPTWSAGPIDFSGAVDVFYTWNTNNPASGLNAVGAAPYNFDDKAQQFSLGFAKIGMSHSPDPVGFEVDLGYGQTMELINLATVAASPNSFDAEFDKLVEQAIVEWKPAAAKGFELDFGKFTTTAGAEVIESYTNWNYSHSLLFSLAIPYYHFGLRSSFPIGKHMTGGFQVVNGWNNTVDDNRGKTIGLNLTTTFSKWTWVVDYYGGPENFGTDIGKRQLIDTTLTLTPSGHFAAYLNYDYGQNRNVNFAGTGTGSLATWQGFAGALHFTAGKFSITPRGEYYDDPEGFTTGSGVPTHVYEFTGTAEYKFLEGLMWRAEYRHDWSDQDIFERGFPCTLATGDPCLGTVAQPVLFGGAGNYKSQNTIAVAIIAFFGPKR